MREAKTGDTFSSSGWDISAWTRTARRKNQFSTGRWRSRIPGRKKRRLKAGNARWRVARAGTSRRAHARWHFASGRTAKKLKFSPAIAAIARRVKFSSTFFKRWRGMGQRPHKNPSRVAREPSKITKRALRSGAPIILFCSANSRATHGGKKALARRRPFWTASFYAYAYFSGASPLKPHKGHCPLTPAIF